MSGIFISYRREDSTAYARLLSDTLADRFGSHLVFRDVDTMGPGVDFPTAIAEAVDVCDVLLALIGEKWLTAEQGGHRRLDDENDYVRLEIATALDRGILVVPILLEGTRMPSRAELPEALAKLANRNAHRLTDESWSYGVDRLVTALRKVVAPPPAPPPLPPVEAAPQPTTETGRGPAAIPEAAAPPSPPAAAPASPATPPAAEAPPARPRRVRRPTRATAAPSPATAAPSPAAEAPSPATEAPSPATEAPPPVTPAAATEAPPPTRRPAPAPGGVRPSEPPGDGGGDRRRNLAILAVVGVVVVLVLIGLVAGLSGGGGSGEGGDTDETTEVTTDSTAVGEEPAAQVETTLDLSPSVVTAGESLTIRGEGFQPNEKVQITSGDEEPGETVADADGRFTERLPITEDTELGTYEIRAEGMESGRSAVASVDVAE